MPVRPLGINPRLVTLDSTILRNLAIALVVSVALQSCHHPGVIGRPQARRRPVGLVVADELHIIDIGAAAKQDQIAPVV